MVGLWTPDIGYVVDPEWACLNVHSNHNRSISAWINNNSLKVPASCRSTQNKAKVKMSISDLFLFFRIDNRFWSIFYRFTWSVLELMKSACSLYMKRLSFATVWINTKACKLDNQLPSMDLYNTSEEQTWLSWLKPLIFYGEESSEI